MKQREGKGRSAVPKRCSRTRFSIRFRFFVICMLSFVLVAVLADIMGWIFKNRLDISFELPLFVWAILFSLLAGGAVVHYVTSSFFEPVTRLGEAMRKVAGGDFQMSASCGSRLEEIQDIYASFNLMVRELEATETLQTDFISGVSHEFKTPINAIEGYASLLQTPELSSEEQAKYVEKILFNTRRLSTLTGNILLLSKITNQSIRPQRTTYRLDEQVRQAVVFLEPKWTEKDICLDVDLDPVEYTGCEGLLFHVWSNLIDNAVKFDPPGGLVRLRMHEADGFAEVTVDDSGPGIAPEEQDRVFNKFYQSDGSHEKEGSGIGLALVKKIVELSGGTVTVRNLPGAGCRFTVRLPL